MYKPPFAFSEYRLGLAVLLLCTVPIISKGVVRECPAIADGTGYSLPWAGIDAFKGVSTTDIKIGAKSNGNLANNYCGFFKFDLSGIPADATITEVQLKVYPIATASAISPKVKALTSDPTIISGGTIWSEAVNGTDLLFGNTWVDICRNPSTVSALKSLDSDARTLVSNSISRGWCGIALLDNQLNLPLYGSLAGASASAGKPTLTVTWNSGPPNLLVTPTADFGSTGHEGGPFSPISMTFTLKNNGASQLNWSVTKSQNWLTCSKTSGILQAGASTTLDLSLTANANALSSGSYSDVISFKNNSVAPNQIITINAILTVHPPVPTVTATLFNRVFAYSSG